MYRPSLRHAWPALLALSLAATAALAATGLPDVAADEAAIGAALASPDRPAADREVEQVAPFDRAADHLAGHAAGVRVDRLRGRRDHVAVRDQRRARQRHAVRVPPGDQ